MTIAVFALASGAPLFAQTGLAPRIYWLHSVQTAVSLAQRYQLPILVYVTSKDCGYCRKMERDCWSHPQIVAMVDDGYIPLELDAQRDAELIAALKVRGYPTTLVFSSDARFLHGAAGYLPPNQLAGLLRAGGHPPESPQQVAQQSK